MIVLILAEWGELSGSPQFLILVGILGKRRQFAARGEEGSERDGSGGRRERPCIANVKEYLHSEPLSGDWLWTRLYSGLEHHAMGS